MDSLTHIVLGACVGEAFFEKGFGKKAMVWGVLAQSIPDIDFIASFWLDNPDSLLAHRGFTHSILFALLIIPIFSLTADRIHKPHNILFRKWVLFFAAEIFAHLFIDAFNNYGIGWFEPFSHFRFSFNIIYVADPFFSIVPGIAFVFLIVLNRYHLKRKLWWKLGIIFPIIYLTYCCINKIKIDNDIDKSLKSQNISVAHYFSTPAPLQNWLWYIVVPHEDGFYVGYRSVFDHQGEIDFKYFKKNEHFLSRVSDHEELQKLKRFSKGYYTAERIHDTIIFNDLRFGQTFGWRYPNNIFVFHYYLKHPQNNNLLIQRGRFSNWDLGEMKYYLHRVVGI